MKVEADGKTFDIIIANGRVIGEVCAVGVHCSAWVKQADAIDALREGILSDDHGVAAGAIDADTNRNGANTSAIAFTSILDYLAIERTGVGISGVDLVVVDAGEVALRVHDAIVASHDIVAKKVDTGVGNIEAPRDIGVITSVNGKAFNGDGSGFIAMGEKGTSDYRETCKN